MRVGILAIQHESNTFLAGRTTLDDFRRDALLTGQAMRSAYGRAHHEVGGFFAALEEAGLEAAPILLALAMPSGVIAAETLDQLLKVAFTEFDAAGKLDGLLVAPHGAGVSESHRDMDGYWLSLVRERVGPNLPIICTLDPHANVSRRMIDACNATIAYRSNPHEDQHAIGLEAGRLMARTLRGEIRPVQALAAPPVAISIDRQCSSEAPCTSLYQLANQMLQEPGVLSNSVVLGFPYADVEELGSSFIVVTDGDQPAAQRHADRLAAYLVEHRRDFACGLLSVEQALDEAAGGDGPICLLDMGDNVGGGSAADGTVLAAALAARKMGPSFVCLCDPQAAEQARQAGVGAALTLAMGGKTDQLHGPPLSLAVQVESLHDGRFTESQVRHGGRTAFDMGPSAVVRSSDGLAILLTTNRVPPFSLEQIKSCGLDPAAFRYLVAKGVNAPIAAYREVCRRFIRVNTPGVTSADMTSLKFEHRRRPLFPFEEIAG